MRLFPLFGYDGSGVGELTELQCQSGGDRNAPSPVLPGSALEQGLEGAADLLDHVGGGGCPAVLVEGLPVTLPGQGACPVRSDQWRGCAGGGQGAAAVSSFTFFGAGLTEQERMLEKVPLHYL